MVVVFDTGWEVVAVGVAVIDEVTGIDGSAAELSALFSSDEHAASSAITISAVAAVLSDRPFRLRRAEIVGLAGRLSTDGV